MKHRQTKNLWFSSVVGDQIKNKRHNRNDDNNNNVDDLVAVSVVNHDPKSHCTCTPCVFLLQLTITTSTTPTTIMTIRSCHSYCHSEEEPSHKMYKNSNDIYAVAVNIVIIIVVVGLFLVSLLICSANALLFAERSGNSNSFSWFVGVQWWLAFNNNNIDSDTDTDINSISSSNGQCSSAFNIVYEHSANNDENNTFMFALVCLSVYRASVIQPWSKIMFFFFLSFFLLSSSHREWALLHMFLHLYNVNVKRINMKKKNHRFIFIFIFISILSVIYTCLRLRVWTSLVVCECECEWARTWFIQVIDLNTHTVHNSNNTAQDPVN